MGLFDSLFGRKKPEAPPVAEQTAEQTAGTAVPELDAKIPAAIAASVVNAAIAAAITAAVIHNRGSVAALSFKRPSNIWSLSGRQQIMASRQF